MNIKKTILIVEDEQITALFFEHLLHGLGYEVVGSFPSAEQSIEFVKELTSNMKPDIVLLDIILKGQMDGIDCADKLIQDFNPAIVFVTSNSDPSTKARANNLGDYPYLIKPINVHDLERNIRKALDLKLNS